MTIHELDSNSLTMGRLQSDIVLSLPSAAVDEGHYIPMVSRRA